MKKINILKKIKESQDFISQQNMFSEKEYQEYILNFLIKKKKSFLTDLSIKDLNKYYNFLIKLQTPILKGLE